MTLAHEQLTMNDAFRSPHVVEREVLEKLLECDFPGCKELRTQLKSATVRALDEDGSLGLRVMDAKPAPVKYRVPVEGSYVDDDGVIAHVLLHVVDGIMSELEIFKENRSAVRQPPTAVSLVVTPQAI